MVNIFADESMCIIRLVLYWQLTRCIMVFDLWRLKIDASRLVQGLVVEKCLRPLDVSKERSGYHTTTRCDEVLQPWPRMERAT